MVATEALNVRIPPHVKQEIKKFAAAHGHTSITSAVLDLVTVGLNTFRTNGAKARPYAPVPDPAAAAALAELADTVSDDG